MTCLTSQILSSALSNMVLMLSIPCFNSFIIFFSSRISVGFFFMIFMYMLNFLFGTCIFFLISLNFLSVLSCNLHISISLELVTGKLLFSFGGLLCPWYFMFLLALLFSHLKKQSPSVVSKDWLWKRKILLALRARVDILVSGK